MKLYKEDYIKNLISDPNLLKGMVSTHEQAYELELSHAPDQNLRHADFYSGFIEATYILSSEVMDYLPQDFLPEAVKERLDRSKEIHERIIERDGQKALQLLFMAKDGSTDLSLYALVTSLFFRYWRLTTDRIFPSRIEIFTAFISSDSANGPIFSDGVSVLTDHCGSMEQAMVAVFTILVILAKRHNYMDCKIENGLSYQVIVTAAFDWYLGNLINYTFVLTWWADAFFLLVVNYIIWFLS